MLRPLIEYALRHGERQTGESADFAREMYAAAPGGFWRFAFFMPMSRYRKTVPVEALAVAGIAAIHAEDCGPCLQTTVNLATAEGVSPDILRAAVTGDVSRMGERTRTAFEFAEAIVARDLKSEELRPLIELWWGKAGIVELSLAIAAARVFPTVKRTMGHAQACSRVVIGHETVRAELASPRTA